MLLKRYIWLVELIERSGRITLEEIQERWLRSWLNVDGTALPRRTFHDHKSAVQELFNIDIECAPPKYEDRIADDDLGHEGIRQWMIEAFSVNRVLAESTHMSKYIMLENISTGTSWLTDILEAIDRGTALLVTYRNFFSEESHTFIIEPYGLRLFQHRWYLVANNPYMDNQIRIYGLDRIEALELTEQKYEIPKSFSLEEHFSGQFGIVFSDLEPEVIKVKADKYHTRCLQALPLHPTQQLEEQEETFAIFSYYLKPTYDFYRALLSMSTHVEVLSPQYVRDAMHEELKKILHIYEKE